MNTYPFYSKSYIQNYKNIKTIDDLRNSAIGTKRYLKVNISSYFRHKTVEFRQHEGSTDIDTVVNWIRFCVNFVNYTATHNIIEKDSSLNGLSPIAKNYFTKKMITKKK